MSWLSEWFDGGQKGAFLSGSSPRQKLVKRDLTQSVDNGTPVQVQLSMSQNTTRNWSYTFYLTTKIGREEDVQHGAWTINSSNYSRRNSIFSQIESAYATELTRISGVKTAPEPVAGPFEVAKEEVEGFTFTIERFDNYVDFSDGYKGSVWVLKMSGNGQKKQWQYRSLADAEAGLIEKRKLFTVDFSNQTSRTFEGITVFRTFTAENTFSKDVPKSITYFMTGGMLPAASMVDYNVGDMVGQFGPLDGDEEHDFGVFEQYITDALAPEPDDPNQEGGPTVEERWVPVPFKGWEDAFDMADSPFASGSKIEESEVAGDQIAMEKNTGVFGFGDRYSAVYLYIKPEFKVVIDVDAKGLEKSGPGDEDVSFEAQLVGGDAFVLDFVSRNSPTVLSVLLNGEEASPYTPEDTSFEIVDASATVVLVNIYKRETVPVDEPEDDGREVIDDDDVDDDMTPTGFANMGVLAIAGVVLLLFVGVLARVGKKAVKGTEEATE